MPNLNQRPFDQRMFVLHVGSSGSGKSCASAFYPGKKYYFDCDRRIDGLRGHPLLEEKIKSGEIEYDEYPKEAASLEKIDAKLTELANKGAMIPYGTVVLSTITTFDDIVMAYMDSKIESSDKQRIGRYTVPGMRHYLGEDAAFTELIGDLKKLKCNVIVEAHWTTKYKSAEPGQPKIIPVGEQVALRDKMAEVFPVDFNDVFFFEKSATSKWDPKALTNVEEVKYEVVTHGNLARTTMPGLPSRIDWTGKDFWKVIKGQGE